MVFIDAEKAPAQLRSLATASVIASSISAADGRQAGSVFHERCNNDAMPAGIIFWLPLPCRPGRSSWRLASWATVRPSRCRKGSTPLNMYQIVRALEYMSMAVVYLVMTFSLANTSGAMYLCESQSSHRFFYHKKQPPKLTGP